MVCTFYIGRGRSDRSAARRRMREASKAPERTIIGIVFWVILVNAYQWLSKFPWPSLQAFDRGPVSICIILVLRGGIQITRRASDLGTGYIITMIPTFIHSWTSQQQFIRSSKLLSKRVRGPSSNFKSSKLLSTGKAK
jgi:hypothetical protein